MPAVETLLLLIAGFALFWLLGHAVVRLTLPADVRQEFGHLIAAPTGYMLLCLFGFALSGGAGLPAANATLAAAAALGVASIAVLFRYREPGAFRRFLARAREIVLLSAPLAVVMLWPLFVDGVDTYLGAVNPDYFAGLVDDYFLLKGHSVADFSKGRDTYFPLDYMAGSISSSGRFASGLVALVLAKVFMLEIRTALTLSIALFLTCLPLALYFFSRVVFGLDVTGARISAWLIGISAPVTMSYLYFYLGQNSGLAALVVTLTVGYLLLTRRERGLLVLFTLLVNALLVVYLGMLPYAIAPLGVLGLYLLFTRRLAVTRLAILIAGFVVISAIVNFGMLASLYAMVRGWSNVIGQTLQGQYFVDFLTEAFFPYFFGVVVYPLKSSYLWAALGPPTLVIVAILTVIAALTFATAFFTWTRTTADRARLVTVLSAFVIYSVVWWIYCFERQYGYAVFKMSSWLQFMLVPVIAFGIRALMVGGAFPFRGWKRMAFAAGGGLYVVTNVIASVDFGIKGLGKDPTYGYIVNNYDMSGNRDYFAMPPAVRSILKPGESVGLAFVDSIQQFWVAYYLRDLRTSLLAHENIPGDDENLPDIHTNRLVDYYGNVRLANNVFFHGAEDAYYLIWNEAHTNKDVVIPRFAKPPVWQNDTFRLYHADENPGLAFTGRGFYRIEYSRRAKPYWWPERARWTAEGGEVYLLRPQAGKPYRITFDAIVGYEKPNDARTVELWVNQQKFDEITVTSAARYVSKPFVPSSDVNKLVIKVKERVPPGKRFFPLWNKHIPFDYRQLNLMLSDVYVLPEDAAPELPGECGALLRGNDIHRCARAFNGVQVDRWVGQRAYVALPVNGAVSKLRVSGYLPANLGFKLPYTIKFRIEGADVPMTVQKAGDFMLEVPVSAAAGKKTLDVEMAGSEAREMTDEYEIRHKVVTQSFRLDALELR